MPTGETGFSSPKLGIYSDAEIMIVTINVAVNLSDRFKSSQSARVFTQSF
jgi:hypothetical protein